MALRLSASLGELDKLACCFPVSDSIMADYMDTPPFSNAALRSQLALARQQILVLESENAFFREEVDNLRRNASSLIAEISVLQVTLEYVKQSKTVRFPVPDKEKIFQLEKRLADHQKLVHALAVGLSLNASIIDPTDACIHHGREPESAMVEAIQDAARNKDSLWSRILPTLTKSAQEKHIAAVKLVLNTRNDLHNMEKLAHFWKARATLSPQYRSGVFYRNTAGLSPRDESGNDLTEITSNVSFPVRPPLLLPVSSKHLKENMSRGIKSSSLPLRCSHSDGMNSPINQPLPTVRTKLPRRAASHDFKALDIQVPEKRHGFIMPCIQIDLNKRSSSPANAHSGLNESSDVGAGSSGLSTEMLPYGQHSASCRVSLARIYQSAERLCATFSSGSLGSLETSTLSGPSTEAISDPIPNDSQSFQDVAVVDTTASVKPQVLAHSSCNHDSSSDYSDQMKSFNDSGHVRNCDFTFPGEETIVQGRSKGFDMPSSTRVKLTKDQKAPLPSPRATTSRDFRQSTSQPTARTVRPCRSGVPQSFPNQSRAALPSLRVQVPALRNSNRTLHQTSDSGFTLKSALAKPITMTSVTPQGTPQSASNSEVRKHVTSPSKLRSRLRVVNNGTQGELSSNQAQTPKLLDRRRHDSTSPYRSLPRSTVIQDGNQSSQPVSRGKNERGKAVGSMSGTTGDTGRNLSHLPPARIKTAKVEKPRT